MATKKTNEEPTPGAGTSDETKTQAQAQAGDSEENQTDQAAAQAVAAPSVDAMRADVLKIATDATEEQLREMFERLTNPGETHIDLAALDDDKVLAWVRDSMGEDSRKALGDALGLAPALDLTGTITAMTDEALAAWANEDVPIEQRERLGTALDFDLTYEVVADFAKKSLSPAEHKALGEALGFQVVGPLEPDPEECDLPTATEVDELRLLGVLHWRQHQRSPGMNRPPLDLTSSDGTIVRFGEVPPDPKTGRPACLEVSYLPEWCRPGLLDHRLDEVVRSQHGPADLAVRHLSEQAEVYTKEITGRLTPTIVADEVVRPSEELVAQVMAWTEADLPDLTTDERAAYATGTHLRQVLVDLDAAKARLAEVEAEIDSLRSRIASRHGPVVVYVPLDDAQGSLAMEWSARLAVNEPVLPEMDADQHARDDDGA